MKKLFYKKVYAILVVIVLFATLGFFRSGQVSAEDYQKIGIIDASGEDSDYGRYASRSLIVWGPNQEPAVGITNLDDVKRSVKIDVYRLEKDDLLKFLSYNLDKSNYSKRLPVDVSKLSRIATVNANSESKDQTILPIAGEGIWLLKAYDDKNVTYSAVIRTSIGTIAKEGDGETILWSQDIVSGKKVSGGSVDIYNLKDKPTFLSRSAIDQDGVAKTNILDEADVGFVDTNGHQSLVMINLPISYYYKQFTKPVINTKYFLFTDRPLYAPGDKLHFKSIIRTENDANYNIPQGIATVKVYKSYSGSELLLEKKILISSDGTVSGEFEIPSTAKTGYYTVSINAENEAENLWKQGSYATIYIEHYRKPEYDLQSSTEKDEVLKGDSVRFHLSGKYFFGQPVSGGTVKYSVSVSRSQYIYEESLDYYKKYGYWYAYEAPVVNGEVTLDKKGEAYVNFDTIGLPDDNYTILTFDATYEDSSGNPVQTSQNILVRGNEYSIKAKRYEYYSRANEAISIPVTLQSFSNTSVANVDINVSVNRNEWKEDKQSPKDKYGYYRYIEEKEEFPKFSVKTDSSGNANIIFTPQKTGSYYFEFDVKDSRGSHYTKKLYAWVYANNVPFYSQYSRGISLKSQDIDFTPGDVVPMQLSLQEGDRDVFVAIERANVKRYFVTHVNGNSTSLNIPTYYSDLPNVFVSVSTFGTHDYPYLNDSQQISLRKDSKEINVEVTPSASKYAPGETVELAIRTTSQGAPVSADVVVWAVDKALYKLMADSRQKIKDAFWTNKYDSTASRNSFEGIFSSGAERGGCFTGDTLVLTPSGARRIDEIKIGDKIQTRNSANDKDFVSATVIGTHAVEVDGYLILNVKIKVTPEHRLWVGGYWKNAGDLQIGEELLDKNDNKVKIVSIEWQKTKTRVYNLTVEGKSTYFASDVYVHNDKGDDTRKNFTDVAYWNPSVTTDGNGYATLRFVLPDNLTTWFVQAVAATRDTKVGENAADILVTKDLIVRPVLPNILRVGDDITISTLSHNFSGKDSLFESSLSFDSGDVLGASSTTFSLASNDFTETLWHLDPKKAGNAKIGASVKDKSSNLSDEVQIELPIKEFGFFERIAGVGSGSAEFPIIKFHDAQDDNSTAKIYLSNSLFGTLPPAMDYLLQYPYGCVEQTTSRFVPAVIAKENQSIFADYIKKKDLDELLKKGVERLASLSDENGGWGWWYGEVNPLITAYVVENLKRAEALGAKVPQELFSLTKTRFEWELSRVTDPSQRIGYLYALSILGSPQGREEIKNFSGLTADVVALALMLNIRNGYTDRNINGYDYLLNMAKTTNNRTYWEPGSWSFFGSREASTALAIKALIIAGAEEKDLIGAATYLGTQREYGYWYNSFATSQTIDALLAYTKRFNENSTGAYKVLVGEKQIDSGVMQGAFSAKTISIDPATLKDGEKIRVEVPNGDSMYSTFIYDEWRNGKDNVAKSNGLNITRTYQGTFKPGEVIDVILTVSGIPADSRYLVIEDDLPSGLVPVNQVFDNEKDRNDRYSYYYWGGTREYTENGIVASFSYLPNESLQFTYQARVVSRGTFNVPPVKASLMYEPEVNGRSGTQTVVITGESDEVSQQGDKIENIIPPKSKMSLVVGTLAFFFVIILIFAYAKRKTRNIPTQ